MFLKVVKQVPLLKLKFKFWGPAPFGWILCSDKIIIKSKIISERNYTFVEITEYNGGIEILLKA